MKEITESLSQVQTNLPGDAGMYIIDIWRESFLQSNVLHESEHKTITVEMIYDPCYESVMLDDFTFPPTTLDFTIEPANEE